MKTITLLLCSLFLSCGLITKNHNSSVGSVTASTSTLAPFGGFTFAPRNTIDADPATCWQESAPGLGIGHWIEYTFDSERDVDSVEIWNGFQSHSDQFGDLFYLNSRVKKASICSSREHCVFHSFPDVKGVNAIELNFRKVRSVRITILEAYPGSKWQDTSISEVRFTSQSYGGLMIAFLLIAAFVAGIRWKLWTRSAPYAAIVAHQLKLFWSYLARRRSAPATDYPRDAAEIEAMPMKVQENRAPNRSAFIIGAFVLASVGLYVAHTAGYLELLLRTFSPPQPVIVSKTGDDLSSRLFEYSMRAAAEVRNDGGPGVVVFVATAFQGGESWTKTSSRHMEAHETATFEVVFDEVSLLGGQAYYSVKVYSGGK